MSLGLRGGSKLHNVLGLLNAYGQGKLKDLVALAQAYAKHHHVDAAFRSLRIEDGWRISFHPAAPDIVLSVSGGYVVLQADTLEAGPGYHAFVVDFIGYLSRQHQWVWEFRDAIQHFADDTGYFHDRDFAALQAVMATEFAAMCEGLLELEKRAHVPHNIWLPAPLNLAAEPFAATSLGFRDRAFFDPPQPERFFPWWEEGLTPQVVKNMALCKMWLETSWQPPANAGEQRDLGACRDLIERARAMGAEFTDSEGAGDIDLLLRDEALDLLSDADNIGYWRRDAWYQDAGGWLIALPASHREEIGDEDQLCALVGDDRAVYMRCYVNAAEQTPLEWPEPKTEGYREYLRFETEQCRVVIEAGEMDEDEDGIRWWRWHGLYNAPTGSALITVVSSNEDDAAWAEKVLRSVQPPADAPDPNG